MVEAMKRYRNIDTRAVIETRNTIRGEKWQEIKTPAVSPDRGRTKRKAAEEE